CTARGKDRLLGPDDRLAMLAVPDDRPPAGSAVGQQIDNKRLLPELDVGQSPRAGDQSSHHLFTGSVAEGVRDPAVTVPAFLRQGDLAILGVEDGPPFDQLLN